VQVEVRLKQDQLQLRLTTETSDARRVLMSQLGELRASLEQQGLRVQRIEVSGPPAEQLSAERDGGEMRHPSGADSNVESHNSGSGAGRDAGGSGPSPQAEPADRPAGLGFNGEAIEGPDVRNDPIETIGEGRLDIHA
jgi:hypothetical protein